MSAGRRGLGPREPRPASEVRIAFYAPLKAPSHAVASGDRAMASLMMRALGEAGHAVTLASILRSYDGSPDGRAQQDLKAAAEEEAAALTARYHAAAPEARPELWFTYHLYYRAPDWIGPALSRTLGIAYVVAEASHAPKRALGPWRCGHEAAAAAIAQADAVMCMTALDMKCVRDLIAAPDRLFHMPPFLDAAPFAAAAAGREAARATFAQRWAVDGDAIWLLAVGMMRPGDKLRSYQRLAEALALLDRDDWRLIVIGEGEARGQVESAFARLGPGRVAFAGGLPAEAMPAVFAAADIYAWPAVNEAYGMAMLEAQAAGLSVVAGDVGGVRDVVCEGETGFLVADGAPAQLAERLGRLIGDAGLRRRMGEAAKAYIGAERTLARAAERLDRALERARAR